MNCPFCNAIVPKGHTQCCFCGEIIEDIEVLQTAVELHEDKLKPESIVQRIDEPCPTDETFSISIMEPAEQDMDLMYLTKGNKTTHRKS